MPSQCAITNLPSLIAAVNSSHVFASTVFSLRRVLAEQNRSVWIKSRVDLTRVGRFSSDSNDLVRVSLRASSQVPFSRSRGPKAIRRGTPFSSYSANFHPERLASSSSSFTRIPAALRSASTSRH